MRALIPAFVLAGQGDATSTAASAVLSKLDEKQKNCCSEAVNSIDFTHSNRLALNTINNLTGKTRHQHRCCSISAYLIALQLVQNGVYKTKDCWSATLVMQGVSELWKIPKPPDKCNSGNFSTEEFGSALQLLKSGNAQSPDSICSELILHAGSALKSWLNKFLSCCSRQLKLPKIRRRAFVVAILKPSDPRADPKSHIPISLQCVLHKIFEKLIYADVKPIIDLLLPREQAGFRRGKPNVDQVSLLIQEIEDSFSAEKMAGSVFVNLTSAYDTVWYRGFTCKLLHLVLDRHIVAMIVEFARNYSFTLTSGSRKQSRLQHLKNGFPRGSILAPLLFDMYTHDLPPTTAKKSAYADETRSCTLQATDRH